MQRPLTLLLAVGLTAGVIAAQQMQDALHLNSSSSVTEALDVAQVLIPLGVCAALTVAGVWYVARQLHQAAVK